MKHKIFGCCLCLLNIVISGFAFGMVAWYRTGTRVILRNYFRPFLGFLVIWILISIIGGKYDMKPPKRLRQVIGSIISNNVTAFAIILILMYTLRTFYFSRYIVLGTIGLTTILEIFIFALIYYTFKFKRESDIAEKALLMTRSERMRDVGGTFYNNGNGEGEIEIPYKPTFCRETFRKDEIPLRLRGFFEDCPEQFGFFREMIELYCFPDEGSFILKSPDIFNIEHVTEGTQQVFINLHRINDIRRINCYFIRVNKNLREGGVFICCGETIEQRQKRFRRNVGTFLGNIAYFFDFLYRRISPKIPVLQGIYFSLTKGQNRTLSETEILGRLFYCGFRIIGYREIEGMMYFVTKKAKEPSSDPNPSYGPLIKLRRIGLNGDLFYCYKLRTMHPYSEYLQEYVHSHASVSYSGKFNDDFRVTSWGKFMRRYWIDELPQFINLFRGDVRIIGTRALSRHFFEQYPGDIKEMRLKVKPGLIPVYTADRVTNLVDLIESERRYLRAYMQSPLKTDMKYLSKAMFNILTRRVKSLDCYN